jgi:hypothetical protein
MTGWKLVPIVPITEMLNAVCIVGEPDVAMLVWQAMVHAAPPHPCETLTAETARDKQRWKGMDGVTAWNLIDRYAEGWSDIGLMMDAWLEANK